MPPRKRLEATVYIIDCKSNVEENLKIFYKIYAVKYLEQSQDLQRIILFNCPNLKVKHFVNDWSVYELNTLHIVEEQFDKKSDNIKPHNFLNVINSAIETFEKDLIKDYVKRIVFISNFTEHMEYGDKTNIHITTLQENLLSKDIWLYFIGPDVYIPRINSHDEIKTLNKIELTGPLTPDQKENFAVLKKLLSDNMVVANLNDGFNLLNAHKIKPKAPFPWYVNLTIGNNVHIPVHVHKSIRPHVTIKFKPCPIDENKTIDTYKQWCDAKTHEVVPNEDVVRVYKFHEKTVSMSQQQFKDNQEEKTKKCLTVFAFTKLEHLHLNLYVMLDSLNYLRADKRGKGKPDDKFDLFVKSLRLKNVAALAYRVYNDGNGKKLFCIFPCPEHQNDSHLLMAQIPYQHELCEQFVRGPPIKLDIKKEEEDDKAIVWQFLKAMATEEDEGRVIHPLPEFMQLNESRTRKAEVLAYKNMKKDVGEPPQLEMDPYLQDLTQKYLNIMSELNV